MENPVQRCPSPDNEIEILRVGLCFSGKSSQLLFESPDGDFDDDHFLALRFRERALPATRIAMATACFWGLPTAISVLMFDDTVLRDLPFLSGIGGLRSGERIDGHGGCSGSFEGSDASVEIGKDFHQFFVKPVTQVFEHAILLQEG
jgi:hypothetical protein